MFYLKVGVLELPQWMTRISPRDSKNIIASMDDKDPTWRSNECDRLHGRKGSHLRIHQNWSPLLVVRTSHRNPAKLITSIDIKDHTWGSNKDYRLNGQQESKLRIHRRCYPQYTTMIPLKDQTKLIASIGDKLEDPANVIAQWATFSWIFMFPTKKGTIKHRFSKIIKMRFLIKKNFRM